MNVRCTSYVPNHPWFATGLKRKRSTVRSSDADGSVEAATKKRRQNAIERGMASLTLEPSAITQSAASQIPPPAAAPYSQSVIPSLSPAIAETSRPVQEVRMKSASSYEPEKDRVVVLSLDSDESDDDTTSKNISQEDDNDASYYVLSSVVSHLKNLSKDTMPKNGQDESRALVLFKPVIPLSTASQTPPTSPTAKPVGLDEIKIVEYGESEDVDMMELDS